LENSIPIKPTQTDSLSEPITQTRVLIADDNEVTAYLLQQMLWKLGFENVDVVTNGSEAIALFERGQYNLVLMDKQMPKINGLEATRRIRKFEKKHSRDSSKIIAITADTSEDLKVCLEAGSDDYLTKPFTMDKLSAILVKMANS